MARRLVAPFCVVALGLAGCASTQFQTSGQTGSRPLCDAPGEHSSALVLWGPRWRPNQKNVPNREAIAQRGIERFFASSGCFGSVRVLRRLDDGTVAGALSPAEANTLAAAPPGRTVFITVRELGPVLKLLGSPALVDGGTEVVLDIQATASATGEQLADFQAHWQNGGPWVIKGQWTLERDIESALRAALKPNAS